MYQIVVVKGITLYYEKTVEYPFKRKLSHHIEHYIFSLSFFYDQSI